LVWRVTNEPFLIDWNAQGEARVLQNIANLLRMWSGETPFLRNVGISVAVHDAPTEDGHALAMSEVARNIADYAPEADLKEIIIEDRPGGLYIAADVEVVGI